MEDLRNYINTIRHQFAKKSLDEKDVPLSPFELYHSWFEDAVGAQVLEPNAMSVCTVDVNGRPSQRIVYLRDISENGMVFYTNYQSQKGADLEKNNQVCLNFFWIELERQIRVYGTVEKLSDKLSDDYFNQRPRASQIGAWASNQSEEIASREELTNQLEAIELKFEGKTVPRPPHWGGYIVKVDEFEFWQGRPNRLHDRLVYRKSNNEWLISRKSP